MNKQEISLTLRNNIKDIYVVIKNSNNNYYAKDRSNYSLNNNKNSNNTIDKLYLNIYNNQLFSLKGDYTNYIIPYENYGSTPSDGINVINFNLKNSSQPYGSLNFSMINQISLILDFNTNLDLNDKEILIFGNSYNILRINSGLGGIAFIQ